MSVSIRTLFAFYISFIYACSTPNPSNGSTINEYDLNKRLTTVQLRVDKWTENCQKLDVSAINSADIVKFREDVQQVINTRAEIIRNVLNESNCKDQTQSGLTNTTECIEEAEFQASKLDDACTIISDNVEYLKRKYPKIKKEEPQIAKEKSTDIREEPKKIEQAEAAREESERIKASCKKAKLDLVISVNAVIHNSFDSNSYWAETRGLGPYGEWLCYDEKLAKKVRYFAGGPMGRQSFAVIKGIKGKIQQGDCGSLILSYVGTTKSRNQNGFETELPIWKIVDSKQAEKMFDPVYTKNLGLHACVSY